MCYCCSSKNFYKTIQAYERIPESNYKISPYIAEFYNTLSNLPFIIVGIYRLGVYRVEQYPAEYNFLYFLTICIGICSGFHHATPSYGKWKKTIVIDYIPIVISLIVNFYMKTYLYIQPVTWFMLFAAVTSLVLDHTRPVVKNINLFLPVPIGHSVWHILACVSIDMAYMDVFKYKNY